MRLDKRVLKQSSVDAVAPGHAQDCLSEVFSAAKLHEYCSYKVLPQLNACPHQGLDSPSTTPRSAELGRASYMVEIEGETEESTRCLQLDRQIQRFKKETFEIRRVALEAEQAWKDLVRRKERLQKEEDAEREVIREACEQDKASIRLQRRRLDSERERFRQRIAEDRTCLQEYERLEQKARSLEEELQNRKSQNQQVASRLQLKVDRLQAENLKLTKLCEKSQNTLAAELAANKSQSSPHGQQPLRRGKSMPHLGNQKSKAATSSKDLCRSAAHLPKHRDCEYSKDSAFRMQFCMPKRDLSSHSPFPTEVVPERYAAHPRPTSCGSQGKGVKLVDGRTLVFLPDGGRREIGVDGTVLYEYHPGSVR